MNDSKLWPILTLVLGLLATISLGIAGWALASVSDLREKAVRFEEKISQLLDEDEADREQNRRLDHAEETMSKFWRIHTATKDYINDTRDEGEAQFRWPVLND